jgi:hypothetical protein
LWKSIGPKSIGQASGLETQERVEAASGVRGSQLAEFLLPQGRPVFFGLVAIN